MNLDKKINELPLTKNNPDTLVSVFGKKEITAMWVADMDFEIAQPIQEALIKRISGSGFAYEYRPESFFKAQKEWYWKKNKMDLIKEQLVFSPSITTSISIIIENTTQEKDGIIIQPPVFMEFKDVIRKTKRRIVKNPLKFVNNERYEIDFEKLAEKAAVENNKILILCNPHNPVGRVWSKEDLEKIVSICKENKVLIIADEIHKDIILFDNQFNSLLPYSKQWKNIIVCTSEAKTFNLCGISDSLTIIPNEDLRNTLTSAFKKYNLGRTNALTRVALEAGYTRGGPWLADLIKTIESNIQSIEKELLGTKIKLIRPEGTYQVWLDFSEVYKDTKEMFRHLTDSAEVGLNAGHWFGREGALFMRMNIATSREKVSDSILRIRMAVDSYADRQ